jgi:AraC-like DNA-binding protein
MWRVLLAGAGTVRAEREAVRRADELVSFVGLGDWREAEVDTLSFGQGRLMLEIDARLPGTAAPVTTDICVSTPVTERLRDSVARLLDLLDDPLDCAVLSPGVLCEIYYEVLRGPHGNLLRNCVRNDARANRIAPIVHYIEENYHRPLGIGAIARVAGMSPSSLHQYFRQATSMSPMQFVKSLRLHQARMLLLSGNPANAASYQVGYNSPSQFSREFKRFFGDRPSQVRATSAG